MTATFYDRVRAELADIDSQGLTKPERIIASRQGPVIKVGGRDVLNFCANNYLGLAGDERVAQTGIRAQEQWGAGTASVRFICGTLEIHKELEAAIADSNGTLVSRLLSAFRLGWRQRVDRGVPLILSRLRLNDLSVLHLPGECDVDERDHGSGLVGR